jgi:hypothetical protein
MARMFGSPSRGRDCQLFFDSAVLGFAVLGSAVLGFAVLGSAVFGTVLSSESDCVADLTPSGWTNATHAG